jgi:hypothetical protein
MGRSRKRGTSGAVPLDPIEDQVEVAKAIFIPRGGR